jgi:hypothetical protein
VRLLQCEKEAVEVCVLGRPARNLLFEALPGARAVERNRPDYCRATKTRKIGDDVDAIIKRPISVEEARRLHIEAMWLAFLRAPAKATGPGEPVDLGEIGQVMFEDQRIQRETPYSVAKGRRP